MMPFLVLLTLSTVDLGRYGAASIAVSNAARTGDLYGSSSLITSTNVTGIRNAVIQDLQTVQGVTATDVAVSLSTSKDKETYDILSVTVSVSFKTVFGFPQSCVPLTKTCQMRIRYDQTRSDGL